MSEGLLGLLKRRMDDEQVRRDEPVAVAELHRRLLPYHTCRDSLGYATKAEYDVAMLRLLADERRVSVAEPALREAVQSEIRQPEPGLGFLQRFAASEIRLNPAAAASSPGGHDEAAAEAGPADLPSEPRMRASQPEELDSGTVCRRCAAPLPEVEGARFCPACGADQVVPTCSECGAEVGEGWRYCAFCGKLQENDTF